MAENPEEDPAPVLNRDVIYHTLFRLPAATIHRFRVVGREWRALTSEGNFITAHRELHPPMPLFFYRRDFGNGIVRVQLHAIDLAARVSHPVVCFGDVQEYPTMSEDSGEHLNCSSDPMAGEEELDDMAGEDERDSLFRVHGSCDGVLLISYAHILYVCNPVTRHWARLPPIHYRHRIIGFYSCVPSSGEGKVVYHILQQRDGFRIFSHEYLIRVLGPPGMATMHKTVTYSPGMPPGLQFLLLTGLPFAYEKPPTMVHGNLHWLPQYQRNAEINMIVVFYGDTEVFWWIHPPVLPVTDPSEGVDIPQAGAFQLLETRGMLAMAIMDDATRVINIWVLHDYDSEVWDMRHQIRMPGAAIIAPIGYDETRDPPGYIASLNEDLMVLLPSPRTLLQCDDNGVVLSNHWRSHHWIICTPHVYQESFVVHDFLMGHGNDDGEPLLLRSPDAFLQQ